MGYFSEIISFVALLLSAFATYKSLKFKKNEKELIEVQKQLNQLMIEKETREVTQAKRADLDANFISIGKQKHRLKIFNKGRGTAYNVDIEFPEGNDIVLEQDLNEKTPLEKMESGNSFDLIAAFHSQSKRKLVVKLMWENENKERDEKLVYPTL